MSGRVGSRQRKTKETEIELSLDLDGSGTCQVETGLPFFDHMVSQLGRHGGLDLTVIAKGDLSVDAHHTVEDVGLALGDALKEALGDKDGITRYGSATVPMEDALVQVALDLSGRPFLSHDVPVPVARVGEYDPALTNEFLRALTNRAGITLHVKLLDGSDPHHIVEAEFKALARALGEACALSGRDGAPSTKGVLE